MESLPEIPSLAPPPGIAPNYVNPESRAPIVLSASIICLIFIIPISLLRFYANLWIKSSFKLEDWVSAFAVAFSVAYTGVVISTLNYTGRHQWDIPQSHDLTIYLQKLTVVIEMMYGLVAFLAKLSLFLLHRRLFSTHKWIRYLVYVGIAVTFVFYTTGLAVTGYLCLPHRGESWLQAIITPRCHRQVILVAYFQGPINVLSDLFILLLPLPVVWKLQVPSRKKLGIVAIFLTGSLACIASIVALYYRLQFFRFSDQTWNVAPFLTCLVIELNVGTMCGSLPYLATFYRHHRQQFTTIQNFASRISPFKPIRTENRRLGSQILGSAQGEGKFLKSGDFLNVSSSVATSDEGKTSADRE